jgi:hypothetical protein
VSFNVNNLLQFFQVFIIISGLIDKKTMKIVLVILAVLVACGQAYEPLEKFVENSQIPQ